MDHDSLALAAKNEKIGYKTLRLFSKKFFFTIFLVILVSILLFFEKIDQSVFKEIVTTVATIFLGADAISNIGTKFASVMTNKNKETPS